MMLLRLRISLLIVGLWSTTGVGAVKADSSLWGLLERDERVISAVYDSEIALSEVGIAQSSNGLKASVSTTGSAWRYDSSDAPIGRGDVGSDTYLDGVVNLSVPVLDFGRSDNRVAAAEARHLSSRVKIEMAVAGVLYDLAKTYAEYTYYQYRSARLKQKKEGLEPLVALQQERYKSGVVSLVAVQELYLYLVKLEAQIDAAKEQADGTLSQLLRRFNLTDNHLTTLETIRVKLSDGSIDDKSATLYLSQREFAAEREALHYERSSLEAEFLPEVKLSGSTRFYDVDQGSLDSFSAQIGVVVTFDLFDSGGRSSRLDGVAARINALESSYRAREKQTEQRLLATLSEAKEAEVQLEALKIRSDEFEKRLEQQRVKRDLSSTNVDEQLDLLTTQYDLVLASAEAEQKKLMARLEYLNETQTLLKYAGFPGFAKE